MFLELCNLFSEENKFWSFVNYRLLSFCMAHNGAFLANFPKRNLFHIRVVITCSFVNNNYVSYAAMQYVVSIPSLFIVQSTLNVWATLTVPKLLRQSTWCRKLQILKCFISSFFRYTSFLQENVDAVKSQIIYKTVYSFVQKCTLPFALGYRDNAVFWENKRGSQKYDSSPLL